MIIILLLLAQVSGQFLLMQPIQNSISSGDFSHMKAISEPKISIQFEPPFKLKGYVYIDKFTEEFSSKFTVYETQEIEWSSKQVDGNYAVQSLNVKLLDTRSEQTVLYKFIFFIRKDKEWKIFYLKGLKI